MHFIKLMNNIDEKIPPYLLEQCKGHKICDKLFMHSHITNTNIKQLEAELREEKSKFAKAFHKGKSMSDLKDLVSKIHQLEKKFIALSLKGYNRQ
ncbi:MAG: hypothetical protein ABI861_04915 [Panacibacter sp.]